MTGEDLRGQVGGGSGGWVLKAPGMVPRTGAEGRVRTRREVLRERGCVHGATGESGGEETRVAKPDGLSSRGKVTVWRQ